MECIILAGGKGTRLNSIVNDRPKPLAEVAGQPFLTLIFDYLISQRCTHFIVSVGYKKEMIKSQIVPQFKGVPITYVEENEPLGTGGAFVKSLNAIKNENPFVVMNGDTSFNIDLGTFRNNISGSDADVGLALFVSSENNRYSRVEISNSCAKLGANYRKAQVGEYAYGGISIIKSKSILNYFCLQLDAFSFEDDFLNNVSVNGAKLAGAVFKEAFVDIGIPEDYLEFCSQHQS